MTKRFFSSIAALLLAVSAAFCGNVNTLPMKTFNGIKYFCYTVKSGDTPMAISKKLNIPLETIKKYNPAVADGVSNRMELLFPVVDFAENVTYTTHRVAKGETLFGISHQYGVSMDAITKDNPQANNGVTAGMILKIPVVSDEPGKSQPAATQTADTKETVNKESRHKQLAQAASNLKNENSPYKNENVPTKNENTSSQIQSQVIAAMGESSAAHTQVATEPEPSKLREPEFNTMRPVNPPTATGLYVDPEEQNNDNDDDNPLAFSSKKLKGEEVSHKNIEENSEESDEENAEEEPDGEVITENVSIAIMLPFMLTEEKPDKTAQNYTDFYRGLLIAADSVSHNRGPKVKIITFDTRNDLARIKSLLTRQDVKDADVIIAPDNEAQLAEIANFAKSEGIYTFNIFSVRDTLHRSNPYVIQANINTQRMLEKALAAFVDDFQEYTPVFLKNTSGKSDKDGFLDMIRSYYAEKGVKPVEVTFDGTLSQSDLSFINPDNKYVFVPNTGNVNDFNKFSGTIKNLKEAATFSDNIAMFGYPEWCAFRGDAQQMLHNLEAVVYSRHFFNPSNPRSENFIHKFADTYGILPSDIVPNYSQFGFDAGIYLIKALRKCGGYLDNYFQLPTSGYDGLQSAFRFTEPQDRDSIEGFENDALLIVKFLPAGFNCEVNVK